MLPLNLKSEVLLAQKNEITEAVVYRQLAGLVRINTHVDVLKKIAGEEVAHYEFLKSITAQDIGPDTFKVFFYVYISKFFGLNFGLKLMESSEHLAQDAYIQLQDEFPKVREMLEDEKRHEFALLELIDEDRLKYVSSVILGLNDALVELTATLAGFTLALQNTRLIGMVGLITGIAAAMSMAASEYLATKHEQADKDPVKASLYTGFSYIGAVALLVLPYFLLKNIFVCLALAIGLSIGAIFCFTFYIAVAKGLNFRQRFFEMAQLSLGIAGITFLIGLATRKMFGVNL